MQRRRRPLYRTPEGKLSKEKKSDWPELEKALCLSDNLQEECEEQDRKFNEAMKALISSNEPSPL